MAKEKKWRIRSKSWTLELCLCMHTRLNSIKLNVFFAFIYEIDPVMEDLVLEPPPFLSLFLFLTFAWLFRLSRVAISCNSLTTHQRAIASVQLMRHQSLLDATYAVNRELSRR